MHKYGYRSDATMGYPTESSVTLRATLLRCTGPSGPFRSLVVVVVGIAPTVASP